MTEFKHIPADDLALYAMQFLAPEETATIAEHLRTCSECRRELATIQGDLAALAHTAEMHTPPALARQRLLTQVGREKKILPVEPRPFITEQSETGAPFSSYTSFDEEDEPRRRSALPLILGGFGWAVAAAVGVVCVYLYRERQDLQQSIRMTTAQMSSLSEEAAKAHAILDALASSTTQRVTLTRAENAPAPTGRVIYRADKGLLLFLASNMEPAAPGKTYELWIIPSESGRSPVPAGTFTPDAKGNASIVMPELPAGVTAKAFGVTVEQEGGSQVPTLPIIMVGM